MKRNSKKLVSVLLTLLLMVSLVFGARTQSVMADKLKQSDVKAIVKNALAKQIEAQSSGIKSKQNSTYSNNIIKEGNPGDIVRVIVQLQDKPSIEKGAKSTNEVKAAQQNVIQKVKDLQGASIKRSFGYLVNGFSMDVKRSEISKIAAMSGVKCVTEAKVYQPDMNFAKNLTQAYSTWKDLGYKGEGMVIAIVDTGIDYTHKDMVITDTSKEKLHASDVAKLGGKGKFFTDKVPYGYNFADNNQNVIDANKSEQHGMHVSGIVAANGNKDDVSSFKAVQGVAPEAQLLAMKVFSNTPGKMDSAYDDDTIAAIEDAVAHKADVINMSLGSKAGFVDENDPEQKAVKNATDNGTLVVISAGNSAISTTNSGWNNPQTNLLGTVDTETVGEPGLVKDSLCVASYENSDLTVSIMDYTSADGNGTMAYATGMGTPEKTLSTPNSIVYCGLGDANGFKDVDVNGKIALIKRGGNTFTQKVQNAEAKGAIGVIIFDKDKSIGGSDDPLNSMSLDPSLTVPIVGIGNASGYKYVDLLKKGDVKVAFTGKMGSIPNSTANEMSAYSSWGPTPNLDFKPEITAPGGDIYSTQNNNKYVTMSGTSMAAPDVSGSEALILQAAKKNLGLTGRAIVEYAKKTAINTAKVEMDPTTNSLVPYSPRVQGSGMIQIEDAINNNVIVSDDNGDAAVSLKEIGSKKTFNLNLKNYGSKDVTYSLSNSGVLGEKITDKKAHFSDYVISGSSITFSKDTVVVPAKGQAQVTVTVTIPSSFATEQFAEGFVKFSSKDSAAPSLSVPFIGFYGNWSKMDIIDKPLWDTENTLLGATSLLSGNSDKYLGYLGEDEYGNIFINPDKIAISPEDDALFQSAKPVLTMLRNAKTMTVDVVDNNNGKENVLRTVYTDNKVRKNIVEDSTASEYGNYTWDGTLYEKSTGKNVAAPDGQYYLRFTAKVDLANATPQALYMPVKVDTIAPTVNILSENVSDDNTKCTITWKVSDNAGGSGVNPLYKEVLLNNKEVNSDITYDDKNDVYSCTVNLEKDVPNYIYVAAIDYAGNIGLADKAVNSPVVFTNLTDGMKLSAKDMNEDGKYVIYGKVDSNVGKLTINNADVNINSNLSFASAIKLNEGSNTVSVAAYDKDGKSLSTKAGYSVSLLTKTPEITITNPAKNPYSVVDQGSVTVSGNVKFEENSPANSVTILNSLGSEIDVNFDPATGNYSANVPVDGFTTIGVIAKDAAGNSSTKLTYVIATNDNEALNINFDDLTTLSTLNKKDISNDTLSITGSVNHRPKIFQINGEDINVNSDLTFSHDFKLVQGKNKFVVYAVDTNDVISYNYAYFVLYDSVSPQVTLTEPLINADGKIYTNKDIVELKGSVTDNTYGYTFSINGNCIINSDIYPNKGKSNTKNFDYNVPVENGSIITINAVDELGNATNETIPVVVDKTAPNKPSITLSNSAVTNKSITAAIAANPSDKDVSKLEYSFDNKNWKVYNAPVTIDQNGTIYARATDNAGNVSESAKLDITNIDKTAPKAPVITLNKNVITIAADPSDNDVAKLEYSLDGSNWKTYSDPFTVTENGTIYARATDKAGNISEIAKLNITNISKPANNQMPKTGSMVSTGSLIGLGSLLTVLGAVVLLRKKKETN